MRKRTGVIRYNLQETGRKFTGQPRKLDIAAAQRLFNGPAMQEAIRKGDIVGYFGHQYREKYGLDVPETVIEGGKAIALEPTVKTVMARCLPDGTLEHEQEFLDTASGRIAARLWESKTYGFSSAIYALEQGGVRVPLGYFGMDFVRAPNYDENRGYAPMLDSVGPGCFSSAELFVTENAALYDSVDAMIRASDENAREISEDYLRVCAQNDALLDECAKLRERLKAAGASGAMLDSAPGGVQRPMVVDTGQAMLDAARKFMAADLPPLEEQETPKEDEQARKRDGIVKGALSLVGSILGGR